MDFSSRALFGLRTFPRPRVDIEIHSSFHAFANALIREKLNFTATTRRAFGLILANGKLGYLAAGETFIWLIHRATFQLLLFEIAGSNFATTKPTHPKTALLFHSGFTLATRNATKSPT
jgi:hypothetical protein